MFGDRWTSGGLIATSVTYVLSERPWRRIILAMLGWTLLFVVATGTHRADPDLTGPAAVEQEHTIGDWDLTPLSWVAIIGATCTVLVMPLAMRRSRAVRKDRLFERDVRQAERQMDVVEEAQERRGTPIDHAAVAEHVRRVAEPDLAFFQGREPRVYVPTHEPAPVLYTEQTDDGIVIRDRRTFDREEGS